jgi:hypothetical protein
MANGTEIIDWQTEMTELEQVTFELKSAEEMVNNQAKGKLVSHYSVIVHLNKAAELLEEIRDSLTTSQARLCGEHPRLYFID